MTGYTTNHKLPYPTDGDPVYKGAQQIQALANAVDVKLSTATGSQPPAPAPAPAPAVDFGPIQSELFGAPGRTRAPMAEIAVSSDIVVPAASDKLAQASWQALVDTDNGVVISGTYGQTRYIVPVSGRYAITYHLLHKADNAASGGAMKILVNGQNVLTNSIASETATPSLEGPTMSIKTEYVFSSGDEIRWAYWYAKQTTILAQGFGKAKSKIVIRYVGPR